jgi:hypothetical protein
MLALVLLLGSAAPHRCAATIPATMDGFVATTSRSFHFGAFGLPQGKGLACCLM